MADECRKRFVAWRQGCVAQFVKIFVPAGGMPRMFNSVERGPCRDWLSGESTIAHWTTTVLARRAEREGTKR
jgi:hypothetical protein